jgi:CMP-N-acetylneuraminic acid synthetase/spore coat polysaccharide biosynthesis predicted glycosyltransferase SpsG
MTIQSRTLIVIPARRGSKGIPRKNMSSLGGQPLLVYSIRTALSAVVGARVLVSTDDEEIASIARRTGAHVHMRDASLARDEVTLDPVVHDAVLREEEAGRIYDHVVTIQPTSPHLRAATVARILKRLAANEADTIITAVDDTHLAWGLRNGIPQPEYASRLNRQQLPPRFRETGGVVATQRLWVRADSRFGPCVALEIVDAIEGLDIDSPEDWLYAEAALGRRRLAFITIGDEQNGLGHVMRTRNLLDRLRGHPSLVLCDPSQRLAIERLQSSFHQVEVCERRAMLERIVSWDAEIVVHDELETDPRDLVAEKEAGLRVVLFEDEGPGVDIADLVFNPLSPAHLSRPDAGRVYGPSAYDLREEFLLAERAEFNEVPQRVLLTFGGTDPAGLTARVLEAIVGVCPIPITIVAGVGMTRFEALAERVATLRASGYSVELLRDVAIMSDIIRTADIAFSSAGRTLYELAHMGVPTIVIRQNDRESHHAFASIDNGFLDLGLHNSVSATQIRTSFASLLDDATLRRAMRERMLSVDLTTGLSRIVNMILHT